MLYYFLDVEPARLSLVVETYSFNNLMLYNTYEK